MLRQRAGNTMALHFHRGRPFMSSVETDRDVYQTLLESTRAIPWRIDWKTMTFSYIGPQIEGKA
jgi:hypothetical protein